MKVFITWSGDRSKRIAEYLKKWLEVVLPGVEAWVSSRGIEKGERWSSSLGEQLEAQHFGHYV